MPVTLIVVALVVALVLGAGAVALAILVLQAARSAYHRTRQRVADQADGALVSLRARALPPGPRQELAGLRRRLRGSDRATARLMEQARAAVRPVGELPDWARRLDRVTWALDTQLAHLEREPDAGRLAAGLGSLRPQVEEVCQAGGALRATIRQVTTATSLTECAELAAGLGEEIEAVQAGVTYLRTQVARSPSLSRVDPQGAAASADEREDRARA